VVWKPSAIELAYVYGGLGITKPQNASDPKARPPSLVIQKGDVDTDKYDRVQATLKFDTPSGGVSVTLAGSLTNDKTGFEISGDTVVDGVFAQVGTKFGPEATNPPCPLVAQAADLKFTSSKDASVPARSKKAANALTIKWIKAPQFCALPAK
jgi:hypothetical protein